jgi:hypothetical protein
MSISGGILLGLCGGIAMVGLAALVCWIDLRRAQGKTTRPGLRRYLPTWMLMQLGGKRVMVPADRNGTPLSGHEMRELDRAVFMFHDHAATQSVAGAEWAAESMMRGAK